MAQSKNLVILIGRLGADPEARRFNNGGMVVNLRVATSQSWRDKSSGEKRERTEWHSVSVTAEPSAKFAEQYMAKGDLVLIQGELRTRKWQDQSGQDRYMTEVVVPPFGGEVQILGKKGEGSSSGSSGRSSSRSSTSSNRPLSEELDDDIPF